MTFLVDPILLAVPKPETATDESFLYYVEQLTRWSEALGIKEKDYFVSEACYLALWDAGNYPDLNNLSHLWRYLGEEQIGVHDMFQACHRVLTNIPYLEDRIPELRTIEVYEDLVRVQPDLVTRLVDTVARALKETLGGIAYAKSFAGDELAEKLSLITLPIDRSSIASIDAYIETNNGETSVEASIALITDPDQTDVFTEIECWQDLLWVAERSLKNLTFSRSLLVYLQDQPFEAGLAKSIFSLLEVLDNLQTCFDDQGRRTSRGHEVIQDFFHGSNAKFSDESDVNKRKFQQELTFVGPDGNTVFCPYHGKVKHREFRVHFTWPVTAYDAVHIVYIGPKITKK